MIYTVIARTDILSKYYKKWDCSSGQPLNLIKTGVDSDGFYLSPDVKKYISDTKNEKMKNERISAYTSLFFSLDKLFNVKPKEILRTEFSKPYIKEKVFFSISHAGDVTAVSLSSDTEVGVDIQEDISDERGEKLNNRFLSDFEYNEGNVDISFLYLTLNEEGNLMLSPLADCSEAEDVRLYCDDVNNNNTSLDLDLYYTKRWTSAEAMSKLFGGGLRDFKRLPKTTKETFCCINTLLCGDKKFIISNAIYR